MPSELSHYNGGYAPLSRAERRELDRQTGEIARINGAVEAHGQRMLGVVHLGLMAMDGAGMISQREAQLVELVPSAAPRVQYIADRTTQELAGLVSDGVRRVSRCSCSR